MGVGGAHAYNDSARSQIDTGWTQGERDKAAVTSSNPTLVLVLALGTSWHRVLVSLIGEALPPAHGSLVYLAELCVVSRWGVRPPGTQQKQLQETPHMTTVQPVSKSSLPSRSSIPM